MKTINKKKKEFALAQIAPYFKDPSTCGFDENGCVYLTEDGRMCVAGKNMLQPEKFTIGSIGTLLGQFTQEKLFKPEAVNILTTDEWQCLQTIHDSIARNDTSMYFLKELNLFTLDELEEYANNLN